MSRAGAEALPFLLPAGLLLAAVTAVPMLDVAWHSLEHRTPFRAPSFAGLDNYARLLADARFWNALWNTVYFAAVSVSLEIVLGLLVALAVVRAGRLRPVVYGAILVPWAIPGVVSARVWEWMYNPEIGLINHLLGSQVNWLGAPWVALHAAILMDVWKSTPFVALLLVAALQGIPRDLYRAAAVDGARVPAPRLSSSASMPRTMSSPSAALRMRVAIGYRMSPSFQKWSLHSAA